MLKLVCAFVSAALIVTPVLAQATSGGSAAQAPAAPKPANDPNEMVCEKQEITGSRIGAKRICMTRAEWADRKLQDRQELERVQVQRSGTKGN